MTTIGRIVLAAIILAAGVGLSALILKFAPEAETTVPVRIAPAVLAMDVQPETVALTIPTQGVVSAMNESRVVSEVAGRVVAMDPRFKAGGEFKAGETMLSIDDADYQAALAQAKANAAEARLALALEEGRAKQARRDWENLSRDGEAPTTLVLRVPQLEAAQSGVEASDAAVEKAERDLARCSVRAPYDCRVVAKHNGLGSFAGVGSMLADVESLGVFEVRLPVALEDFAFIRVPEDSENAANPEVTFRADIAGERREWKGKVVRTEGNVDRASRSVYLVAEVGADGGARDRYLQPGLFVKAAVSGIALPDVYRIPRRAVFEGDRLLMIDKDSKVSFRQITVKRSEPEHVLVSAGLEPGERICLTPLAGVVEQMEVRVVEKATEESEKAEAEAPGNPANT